MRIRGALLLLVLWQANASDCQDSECAKEQLEDDQSFLSVHSTLHSEDQTKDSDSGSSGEDSRTGDFEQFAANLQFMHVKMAQLETALGVMSGRVSHLEHEVHACNAKLDHMEGGKAPAAFVQKMVQEKVRTLRTSRQSTEQNLSVQLMEKVLRKNFNSLAKYGIKQHRDLELVSVGMGPIHVKETGERRRREIHVKDNVMDNVEKASWKGNAHCDPLRYDKSLVGIDKDKIWLDLGRIKCSVFVEFPVAGRFRLNVIDQKLPKYDYIFSQKGKAGEIVQAALSLGAKCGKSSPSDAIRCMAQEIGKEMKESIPQFKAVLSIAEQAKDCWNKQTPNLSDTEGALVVFNCIASKIGNSMIRNLPPFTFLTQLGDIIKTSLTRFAMFASEIVRTSLNKTLGLAQQAAVSKFPGVDEAPALLHSGKHLQVKIRSRRLPAVAPPANANFGQEAAEEGVNMSKRYAEEPGGSIAVGLNDAPPYQSKLVTQFDGVETFTGSCVAFAPTKRQNTGRRRDANTFSKQDWQTNGSDIFGLSAYAVPCDNGWLKDNKNKWEGYATYFWETAIEKCMSVSFGLAIQPTISFIGGITFDIVPEPIAEVVSEICWPDKQPGGQDLSMISSTIKTAGIPILQKIVRLKKRFEKDTGKTRFTPQNVHDTVASIKNTLGVAGHNDDDTGMNTMSRDPKASLLQDSDYEADLSQTFIASAVYDERLGVQIISNLTGAAAWQRIHDSISPLEAVQVQEEVFKDSPSEQGCYYKQWYRDSSGSQKCGSEHTEWTVDTWGKAKAGSHDSKALCLARQSGHDGFCKTMSEWLFVPPKVPLMSAYSYNDGIEDSCRFGATSITDRNECERAAEYLGLEFKGSDDTSKAPSGCFYYSVAGPWQGVKLNSYSGAISTIKGHHKVCKGAAPEVKRVELFSLKNPVQGAFDFDIQGFLNGGILELETQMTFGQFTSPKVTVPLMDIMAKLRIVLAAVPTVSSASKEAALATFEHFNIGDIGDS